MSIHRTYVDKNLTIFAVIGEVTCQELMTTLKTFYTDSPTLDILWDVRQGTVSKLSYNDIRIVVESVVEFTKKSRRRKTAIVISRDVDYGIGRIFGTFAEIKEVSLTVRVFREYDEAMTWLSGAGEATPGPNAEVGTTPDAPASPSR